MGPLSGAGTISKLQLCCLPGMIRMKTRLRGFHEKSEER